MYQQQKPAISPSLRIISSQALPLTKKAVLICESCSIIRQQDVLDRRQITAGSPYLGLFIWMIPMDWVVPA